MINEERERGSVKFVTILINLLDVEKVIQQRKKLYSRVRVVMFSL